MKKRIISILTVLIICFTSLCVGVSAESEPYWEKNAVIDKGILTLTITLRGEETIAGGSVRIDYDPSCLEYVCPEIDSSNCEIRDEDWLGVKRGNINGHTQAGMFITNFFSARAQKPGSILCKVEFKIKEGKTVGNLNLTEDLLVDYNAEVAGITTPINITCKHKYKEYSGGEKYCLYCGSEQSTAGDNGTAVVHLHNFTPDPSKNVPASCKSEGKITEKCVACGQTREATAPVTEHNFVVAAGAAGAPSCTAKGVITSHCATCGEVKEESAHAKGHEFFEDTSLSRESTSTDKGQRGYACTSCGEVIIIELPKL